MPKDTSGITSSLEKQKRKTVVLVEIEDGSPIRYTDWNRPITETIEAASRTFTPNKITVQGIKQDGTHGLEDASLTIQNVDNVIGGLALGADGVRGRRVQVWEGWYDTDTDTFQDALGLFDGRADAVTFDRLTATIQLTAHDNPWITIVPGAKFLPTCFNKFKGPLCQYAGADTTCARSFTDCLSKTNTIHFNGFRFLLNPSKKYWWQSGGDIIPTREG